MSSEKRTEKTGTFTLKGQRYRYSANDGAQSDPQYPWQINVWGDSMMPDAFVLGTTFDDALARAKKRLRAR